MKRYHVRVEFKDSRDMVQIIKARNPQDLEKKVAEKYMVALNYYNDLVGIEYEVLPRIIREDYLLVGVWVGAECLKDYIKENDKGVIK